MITIFFSTFFFLVIYPILLFIMARLLFPIRLTGSGSDLKEFYLKNYRKLFFFGLLMSVLAIPQNWLLLDIPLSQQWNQFIISAILVVPVAWKTRKQWVHYSLVLLMAVMGIGYLFLINPKL